MNGDGRMMKKSVTSTLIVFLIISVFVFPFNILPIGSAEGQSDSDGDGLPDAWETQYGFDPTDPRDASTDPDYDGLTVLQEYQLGTATKNGILSYQKDLFVEVDYMAGYAPTKEGQDYITLNYLKSYYKELNIEVHIDGPTEISKEQLTAINVSLDSLTNYECSLIEHKFHDHKNTHVYVFYAKAFDPEKGIWNILYTPLGVAWNGPVWPGYGAFIFMETCGYQGLIAFTSKTRVERVTLLHEIGHCIGINKDRHPDGSEKYCTKWGCIMAAADQGLDWILGQIAQLAAFHTDTPRYCDHHRSQIELRGKWSVDESWVPGPLPNVHSSVTSIEMKTGDTCTITFSLANFGDDSSSDSYLSISVSNNLQIIEPYSSDPQPSDLKFKPYYPGDPIYHSDGKQYPAEYQLLDAYGHPYATREVISFTIKFKSGSTTSASEWIKYRSAMLPKGINFPTNVKATRDPTSGSKDQQGYYAYTIAVQIKEKKTDIEPPHAPVISSQTHSDENIWYTDNDVIFEWTTPYDASGIAGYSYKLDNSPSTVPKEEINTVWNSMSYTDLSSGEWYFHVRAKDNAGNWGPADHYRVRIKEEKGDIDPPPAPVISSPTHPDENSWYTDNDPIFEWNPPRDDSGIAGYSYTLDHQEVNTPDKSIGTYANSKSYTDLTPGEWYFHVRAKDNAGNWGPADHYRVKIVRGFFADAKIEGVVDVDDDGYYGHISLCWDVNTDPGYGFLYAFVKVYCRLEDGLSQFLTEFGPYWPSGDTADWKFVYVGDRARGRWDFKLELYDPYNNLLDVLDYEEDPDISNISMETEPVQAKVSVNPSTISVQPGATFSVNIDIEDVIDLVAFEIHMSFEPALVECISANQSKIDNTQGKIICVCGWRLRIALSGSATLTTVTFRCLGPGDTDLRLYEVILVNSNAEVIPCTIKNGHVTQIGKKPDLVPNIFWSPTSPLGGDTTAFTVTVKNQGGSDAGAFVTTFYIDGSKMYEWSISGLKSGETATRTFTWTAVEGSHTVGVFADSRDDIDETNNYVEKSLTVPGKPDLIVSSISWSPSSPREGNTVTFTVTIKNQGGGDAGYFKTSYSIDGAKKGEWSISGLSAGQTVTKTFTWTAVVGGHTVSAFADSSYNVDEKYEDNNYREEFLDIPPSTPLTCDVYTDKSTYYIGDPAIIYYYVSKTCDGTLRITKPDGTTLQYAWTGISPGTHSISGTAWYPTGRRTVLFEVSSGTQSASATCEYYVTEPPPTPGQWTLQWSYSYGGYGHSQFAQPIGDIDEDGVNEIIVGGYEASPNWGRARILSYDANLGTYVEEYSWYVPGGTSHSPSGCCVLDLDRDGDLEFVVSWTYSGADGIYAYDWNGRTLATLDYYACSFVFDVYACDYDDDGYVEVLIANRPTAGTPWHVMAFGWAGGRFVVEATWRLEGYTWECPMIWSGDVDRDGRTEVIACISNGDDATAGTWALNWNPATRQWNAVLVYGGLIAGGTHYGVTVGDVDGDGTPEIGIGNNVERYGAGACLFEWDGIAYRKVWEGSWAGEYPIIEALAIGDADNDGKNEFCVGGGYVHIIGWTGSGYVEESTITDTSGVLSGVIIGDCDTDGLNELKACDIVGYGPGREWIFKYRPPFLYIGDPIYIPSPDLTVSDISWTPGEPIEGQTVTFTVTLKNQGGADAGYFKVDYYIDHIKIGEWSVSSLASNQTISKTFTWTAVEGLRIVGALVDSGHGIEESNEDNNYSEESFTVSDLKYAPDLAEGRVDPSSGYPVTVFTFWVKYYDKDNDPAVVKKIWVYNNGWNSFDMNHHSGDPLNGELFVIQLYDPKGWPIGTHDFYFQFSDGEFEVREPTSGYFSFVVKKVEEPKPDLIVSDISWSSSNPKEGEPVTFTVIIKNQGTAGAGFFKTSYYIDEVKMGEWSITSLNASQTATNTFTWIATVIGIHTVKAFVDSTYNIQEQDENNNQRQESFTFSDRPDLLISDISWSPSSPKEGYTVTFTVTIKNQGTVNAGSFKVAYYIDDSKIGEWPIASLNAGQMTTKTFTWAAMVAGSHTVSAFADSSYNVDEDVEVNNKRELSFSVYTKPKPDLIVSDISCNSTTLMEGDTIVFTVAIKNQGDADAGSFKVAYYIDDSKIGEWFISSLSAGQTTTKTFTWIASEGSHTVKAFADSNDDIEESYEINNEREITLYCPPSLKPDLVISSISSSPSAPVENDFVIFTVYIKNQGTLNASSFMVCYFIDGFKTGEWSITGLPAGEIANKTFAWIAVGRGHTVSAFADSNNDIEEKDERNNEREIFVGKLPTDLNADGEVNILDIAIVARAYGTKPGDPKWNPIADQNNDGIINIIDIATVARDYGKKS
jgi:subtilase family serine protease